MCVPGCATPFIKQCFVTAGVSLNLMSHGLVISYSAVLLAQLKVSQDIPIDDEYASWIASIIGISQTVATLTAPLVIRKWGRKTTNLISTLIMTTAWFGIALSQDISTLLAMRFLQGISMGLIAFLGAVLIGEYSTPRYRGAFLTSMSLAIVFGLFLSHTLGAFFSWKATALVCAIIGVVDTLLVFFSPESPGFLALHQKYDECRKVFHWLRGFDEEEELEKMIKANMMNVETQLEEKLEKCGLKGKINGFLNVIKKKEFYKSIIVTFNVFFWAQWSGGFILDSYAPDVLKFILGDKVNFALVTMSLDIHRVIANTIAIAVYRHLKRRKIFLIVTIMAVFSLFTIGLYVYAKTHNLLPYDHVAIGIALVHMHMFSLAAGTTSLPNVLLGEITPLKYRDTCGMITLITFAINLTINAKTAPYLFTTIGLHGAYFLYGTLVSLSFILPWIILPETKDRTLQEIEDMFRGQSYDVDECEAPEPKLLLNLDQ